MSRGAATPKSAIDDLIAEGTGLLDVLLHRAPIAVAVFDPHLVLRRCNAMWADFVQRHGAATADRVVPGRSIFDYFPGTEPVIRPAVEPVLAGKTRWHQAVPHDGHDGTTTYWNLLFVPLFAGGEVVGVVDIALDVTERHRAEAELRRSDRRMRSILTNSSDITVVIDAEGTLKYAGPSVQRLLGVTPEDAVGRDVAAPVHPADVALVREMLVRTAAHPGEGSPFRCRLKHADGGWCTFDAVTVNLLDDPDVAGIVLNLRDVTERTEAEAELRRLDGILEAVRFAGQRFLESHTSWRATIDEVLGRLGRAADVSRVYIFENYRGEDGSLWSRQSHEWIADGVSTQLENPDLVAMSYRDLGLDAVVDIMSRGEVIAGNVVDRTDGERAVLEPQEILSIAQVPIFVDGHWWGFIGFDECTRQRDWPAAEVDGLRAAASTLSAAIGRQHAEERLRQQQEQYRHVFEATGDGLVISDMNGIQVQANPAFYRMHGYQPEELAGKPSTTWVHPDHHRAQREFRRAIHSGRQPQRERRDVRKDGSSFPVQVTGSSFTFRGRPHVLSVVRDDTERAQAFELLEKRISALSTIAASLTVNQALSDTLRVIAASVVGATPAIACSAYVLDPNRSELRFRAGIGLPEGYAEAIEECWRRDADILSSPAFLSEEPRVTRDVVRKGLAMPGLAPLHGLLRVVEWDTVVFVPLESQRRVFGSVNAYYPGDVEPTPDEIAFLRAVADQGAVAVENARLLAEAQANAGLEERQRLARELHDSVSQALYGIALGARTARSLAEHSPGQLAEPLDYVLSLAEAGMTEMRSLIFELRPESLATEGLVAALEKRVAVLRARHQLRVRAQLGVEPRLPLPVKETLFRIAQEALHNTVKHAHAGRVDVGLSAGERTVVLEVVDDGVGFDPGVSPPGHLGLQSMRERAAAHGGTIEIRTGRGAGTTVRVSLPAP